MFQNKPSLSKMCGKKFQKVLNIAIPFICWPIVLMLMLFFLYRNFLSKNQQSKFRFSFKLFPDYDWLLVATIFGGKVFFLLPFSCDTEFNIINMMHSNNSNLHTDILNFVYLQWSLPLYFMGLHWVLILVMPWSF